MGTQLVKLSTKQSVCHLVGQADGRAISQSVSQPAQSVGRAGGQAGRQAAASFVSTSTRTCTGTQETSARLHLAFAPRMSKQKRDCLQSTPNFVIYINQYFASVQVTKGLD